jgi:prepilin-type N-terminal cleavage/methylation domain-containing protein
MRTGSLQKKVGWPGFTLIELLVVIAILAVEECLRAKKHK